MSCSRVEQAAHAAAQCICLHRSSVHRQGGTRECTIFQCGCPAFSPAEVARIPRIAVITDRDPGDESDYFPPLSPEEKSFFDRQLVSDNGLLYEIVRIEQTPEQRAAWLAGMRALGDAFIAQHIEDGQRMSEYLRANDPYHTPQEKP